MVAPHNNLTRQGLCDLINRQAGVKVMTVSRIRQHAKKCDWKLGSGTKISLKIYAAWLRNLLEEGIQLKAGRFNKAKNRQEKSRRSNDIEELIGKMPDTKDLARKASILNNAPLYMRTYHRDTFTLPFSHDHIRMIERMQRAMTYPAWLIETAFRSFGKTCISEGVAMWAINCGHKKFVPIVGPDEDHAKEISDSIQAEYEGNDILYEDFPEVCHAVRALEGKWQRCKSQSYRGKLTHIEWNSRTLVFPMISGSACAGSIIRARGWAGRIRGMKHKRRDGIVLRPDFVVFEDPQTEKVADSQRSCDKLLGVLVNAVLGLSSSTSKISVVVPSTKIKSGDAIDRLTVKEDFPAWQCNNTPLVRKMPDCLEDLWLGEYAAIRSAFDESITGDQERAQAEGTEFYLGRREEMDASSECTWDYALDETEVSPIQHAINILIDRGKAYFAAECQGVPKDLAAPGLYEIDPEAVARRVNGLKRLQAPGPAQVATAFIDVGHAKLDYMAIAWDSMFSGSVMDYGRYPDGRAEMFDPKRNTLESAVASGLMAVVQKLCATQFRKEDGELMPLDRILIDCGDPATRATVFSVCRSARFGVPVMASRGRAHHKFRQPKEKLRRRWPNCYQDTWKSLGRVIIHDACVVREWIQKAFMAPEGGPCSITIYGGRKDTHPELGEGITAEKLLEKLVGIHGEIYNWVPVPGRANHPLDCAVGCWIGAAIEGLRVSVTPKTMGPRRKKKRRGGFKAM